MAAFTTATRTKRPAVWPALVLAVASAGRITASLLAIAFGVAAFAWLASPLGSALSTRFLD